MSKRARNPVKTEGSTTDYKQMKRVKKEESDEDDLDFDLKAKLDEDDDDDEFGAKLEAELNASLMDDPLAPSTAEPTSSASEEAKAKKPKVMQQNSQGEPFMELGPKKRLSVRTWKGNVLIDIREFYGEKGDEKPGKKGISLSLEQFRMLAKNMTEIERAIKSVK